MIKDKKKKRYKAKIDSVVPGSLSGNINSLGSAMLAISLGAKSSDDMRLAASLEFLCLNFNSCAIIVTDDIYRLTLQLRDNISPGISRYDAIGEGEKWFFRNRRLIEKYQLVYDIEIIYLSELANAPQYISLKAQMEALALTSAVFRNELELFARSYMERIFPHEDQMHTGMRYKLAKQYLVEECAYFAYLKDRGWNSLVYAGSLAAFERLADQNIENAPEQLLNLPFISLKFNNRGRVNMSYIPEVLAPK